MAKPPVAVGGEGAVAAASGFRRNADQNTKYVEKKSISRSAARKVNKLHIDGVAAGLGFTEGPAWLPDHRVALTSISHGCVYIVDPSGGVERINTGGGPNGLVLGADGTFYVAQNGGVFGASGPAEPGVQIIDGRDVDYLVAGLGAPNDLVFGPDGRLWITDTRGEIDYTSTDAGLPGRVWAVDVHRGEADLIVERGPVFINGLGFTRDERTLLVTATMTAQLLAYEVAPAGSPTWSAAHLRYTFRNGWPDGMAISALGDAWVALTAGDRLDVVDSAGRCTGSIALPTGSLPTNVCISGDQPDQLFVTAAHSESLLGIRLGDDDPALAPK
jgi:gluconolactonase